MRLRHQVTVTKIAESDQGGGVAVPSKSTVDTVAGSFEPLSSRDYRYAQQKGHAVSHEVKVRDPIYDSGGSEFTPTPDTCELTIDSRTLYVRGVRREDEDTRSFWVFDVIERPD